MYALKGNQLYAQSLETVNSTGYAKRLAHGLIQSAMKADPTLATYLVEMKARSAHHDEIARSNPLEAFVRYRKRSESMRNIDQFLHAVSPRFLQRLIPFLRSRGYECVLGIFPSGAESLIMYGGTTHEIQLSLWIHLKNIGNVFMAESQTRNKHDVVNVIHSMNTERKTRIGEGDRAFDVYESDSLNIPRRFRMWDS